MNKINALFAVGPVCSGQTTLVTLLSRLFDPKQSGTVQVIDVKSLTEWGKMLHNRIGEQVRRFQHLRQSLPDSVMIPLFQIYLEDIRDNNSNVSLVLASGFPTSVDQLILMKSFGKSTVIHTRATQEETEIVMNYRLAETPIQSRSMSNDDTLVMFERRWAEHENRTRPAMDCLNGNVLRLERRHPLLIRLKAICNYLMAHSQAPIDPVRILNAMRWLNDHHHPIHRLLVQIERPKSPAEIIDMHRVLAHIR